VAKLRGFTAYDSPYLGGRCAAEAILGYTPDISVYVQHGWYEVVWYRDADGLDKVAYWIGVAEDHGGGDAFWLLPRSGIPIVRSTVWSITVNEHESARTKELVSSLQQSVESKIGDNKSDEEVLDDIGIAMNLPVDVQGLFGDDDDDDEWALEKDLIRPATEDDYTPEAFDKYLSAEVLLPRGGEMMKATILERTRGHDGLPVGVQHSNPILDTREYVVEFDDGAQETYTANSIAENLYSQIDDEGRHFQLLKEIIDHEQTSAALKPDDAYYIHRNGTRLPKRTTKGWKLLVEWKDGTSTWVPLKDLKDSNPVEAAEYAVNNKISKEPAFAWWVPFVIRKRDRIIGKVKSKYWKRTHKYGIELPKSVDEAYRIDERTGTDFWAKAIAKEMKNVFPAFEFDDDDRIPVGHSLVRLHGIFDVKMDLTRKFRLVANGNETEDPAGSTYASVVSRDSVRLFFLLAALNDLDILSADIQNAYLHAPQTERLYVIAGAEFGPRFAKRPAKIVRALYGLKNSGKAFRDYLAKHFREMGFRSSKADPDVWMRPAVKKNGDQYYQYVISYCDDLCIASEDPKEFMSILGNRVTLKEGSVKEPDQYLGMDVSKWYIETDDEPGKPRWAFSSTTYVKRAVSDVETELAKVNKRLPTKASTPLRNGYRPELDCTPELNAERQNYYQGLIGVLRWACEIGRIDILMPVSLMSRYLASAREGHLDQLFHIFAYLKAHEKSTMVFDDGIPNFTGSTFNKCDWSEVYPEAKELVPKWMPQPRGKSVTMSCFCDADHAGCRDTRRSHSGIFIFVNRAPIIWFSKRQNTVEASTYGSELLAMRIALELIEGLRYKLRMFGVPIDGPCNVFCDNNAVVLNTTVPDSQLKKKHAAVNYHRVREGIAAGTIQVAKEYTKSNLADLGTKLLSGPELYELKQRILW